MSGFFPSGGGGRGMSGYKGAYDNTKSYRVNEVVTYSGASYICIQGCIGIDPTNATYWALFAAAGSASIAIDDTNTNTSSSTLSAIKIQDLINNEINDSNSSSTGTTYSASKIESKLNQKSKVTDSTTNGNIVVDGQEIVVYDDTTLKNASHTHSNKSTLDKLSDNGTNLLFNGSPISSGGSSGTSEPKFVIKDGWTTSGTRNFSSNMNKFYIHNTGNADLTFTINSITITVKSTEEFEDVFDSFTTITINATSTFDANVYTLKSGSSTPDYSVKDVFSGSSNMTRNFSGNVYGLVVSNDGSSALTYTVNGITLTVEGGEVSERYFDAFTSATITSTMPFRAYVKSSYGVTITGSTGGAVDTTPPNNVTNLTTSSVLQTTLTLNWTASTSSDIASYDVYNGSTLLGNVTGTTYSVTGLTANTAYTFTIKAKDTNNNVASGTSVNVTTLVNPPADVTNLTTSGLTFSSVTLNWTASATATSYDVYNGATLLGNVTTTSYSVTGLSATTSYTFKVIAKNAVGSSTGVTTTVTTPASTDTTPPAEVTNLTAGTATINSIPITWTLSNSTDVANYEVAYSTDGGTTYTVASSAVNSSSTSYTITGLTAGTSYTIRVVGIDTSSNRSAGATTTSSTATAVTYTVSVSPAAGTYTSTQNVTLSVSPTGATIYYTTDGTTPTTSSSVYSTAIAVSTTTTIKYFAQDSVGNATSVQSATYTISALPNAVTNLTAKPPTSSIIEVTWTDSTSANVANYEVAYSTDGTNYTVASNTVSSTATGYMVNGLTASTTYTIRVVTIDTSSNRSNPATVQATTAATATYATTGLQMYFDSNTGTAGSNTWTATTGSYTATLTNFNNTTSSGWNNGFLLFDSVNDTASVNLSSNIMGTTSGTIELAFKRNEVSGTGSQTIFDTTNSYYTVSAPSNTSNTLKFYASYNDNGTTKSGSVSSITISPNLLTHFVMVMDTGKVYIYVNGSLTSTLPSTSTSYNVTNWMPLDTQIKLLSYLAKTAPVGMKLIRVYNRALTAQEVSTNYASMGV